MVQKNQSFIVFVLLLAFLSSGCQNNAQHERVNAKKSIVASDTILSGMSESLLPSDHFEVAAVLPPGQCPGHYDMKLSDIAKVKQADLVVSFLGMPFMGNTEIDARQKLSIDAKDRNWMAPDSYITGLNFLADRFLERFPEYSQQIAAQREHALLEVMAKNKSLLERIKEAGVSQKEIIACSMLREPLEWMGFHIVGEYGRPESISAKKIADLTRVGKEKKAVLIVDNLQSGPEAGKGIAEALGIPHVILSNFPSEEGYTATLSANVDAVLTAMSAK
jgi:zinc transport system substrate-binding protein